MGHHGGSRGRRCLARDYPTVPSEARRPAWGPCETTGGDPDKGLVVISVGSPEIEQLPQMLNLFDHFLSVGDELGITRAREYGSDDPRESAPRPLPSESFEWQAVFDAVSEAQRRFTMLELGAGYGRWTVRAAAALRRYRRGVKYRLVAVEAEPTHFRWLQQHTRANGIRRWGLAGTCKLVDAAVAGDDRQKGLLHRVAGH
jgi:hypothetical protein